MIKKKVIEAQIKKEIGKIVDFTGSSWLVYSAIQHEIVEVKTNEEYLFINYSFSHKESFYKELRIQDFLDENADFIDESDYNTKTIDEVQHGDGGTFIYLKNGDQVFFHEDDKKMLPIKQ